MGNTTSRKWAYPNANDSQYLERYLNPLEKALRRTPNVWVAVDSDDATPVVLWYKTDAPDLTGVIKRFQIPPEAIKPVQPQSRVIVQPDSVARLKVIEAENNPGRYTAEEVAQFTQQAQEDAALLAAAYR